MTERDKDILALSEITHVSAVHQNPHAFLHSDSIRYHFWSGSAVKCSVGLVWLFHPPQLLEDWRGDGTWDTFTGTSIIISQECKKRLNIAPVTFAFTDYEVGGQQELKQVLAILYAI